MFSQVDVKVSKRDSTHERGIFKNGTEITIDLEEMVAYHSGLQWNVVRVDGGFKLPGFETYFA